MRVLLRVTVQTGSGRRVSLARMTSVGERRREEWIGGCATVGWSMRIGGRAIEGSGGLGDGILSVVLGLLHFGLLVRRGRRRIVVVASSTVSIVEHVRTEVGGHHSLIHRPSIVIPILRTQASHILLSSSSSSTVVAARRDGPSLRLRSFSHASSRTSHRNRAMSTTVQFLLFRIQSSSHRRSRGRIVGRIPHSIVESLVVLPSANVAFSSQSFQQCEEEE